MIDILFVSFNRLAFTVQSFEALIQNTDWNCVRYLKIADDMSTDGTWEYLQDAADRVPMGRSNVEFTDEGFGGPVAATNWYLDDALIDPPSSGIFAKIDNDFIVCPGWLPEMLRQMELHPRLDILGTEPGPWNGDTDSPAMPGTVHRDINPAEHIGGKGLIRLRSFDRGRPQPGGLNGYFGFTAFQTSHPEVHKAWIKPDLPCFGIDQVRSEDGPWRHLAEEYAAKGWQRLWPEYGGDDHYAWWEPWWEFGVRGANQ